MRAAGLPAPRGFGYDYGEVAWIVGKTEQNCRQIFALDIADGTRPGLAAQRSWTLADRTVYGLSWGCDHTGRLRLRPHTAGRSSRM